MGLRATGCVCETSISHSHSGQLRISPSSTSSSSTSISAEHSGQRSTSPSSDLIFSRHSLQSQDPSTGVLYTRRRKLLSRLIHRLFSVTQHLRCKNNRPWRESTR